MKKAFDKIDRAFLWQKLFREQVSAKLIKALRSMYTVVKSCIRYQSSFCRFFNSYNGLKQGDPCSPILFMFFINDIMQSINTNFDQIFTVDEIRLFLLLYARLWLIL